MPLPPDKLSPQFRSAVLAGDHLGAEQLALNKAFLEEIQATSAALEADPKTSTQTLREQYAAAQNQLAHLSDSRLDPADRDVKRRELQNESNQLETKLAERAGTQIARDLGSGPNNGMATSKLSRQIRHFWRGAVRPKDCAQLGVVFRTEVRTKFRLRARGPAHPPPQPERYHHEM